MAVGPSYPSAPQSVQLGPRTGFLGAAPPLFRDGTGPQLPSAQQAKAGGWEGVHTAFDHPPTPRTRLLQSAMHTLALSLSLTVLEAQANSCSVFFSVHLVFLFCFFLSIAAEFLESAA